MCWYYWFCSEWCVFCCFVVYLRCGGLWWWCFNDCGDESWVLLCGFWSWLLWELGISLVFWCGWEVWVLFWFWFWFCCFWRVVVWGIWWILGWWCGCLLIGCVYWCCSVFRWFCYCWCVCLRFGCVEWFVGVVYWCFCVVYVSVVVVLLWCLLDVCCWGFVLGSGLFLLGWCWCWGVVEIWCDLGDGWGCLCCCGF